MRVAFGIGAAAGDRQTVATHDVHLCISHWRAVANGLHKHIVAAVAGALGDDAKVGDHDKTQVAGAVAFVLERALGRVILRAQLEHENAATAAIGGEVVAQVHVVVDGFRRVIGRQRNIQRLTFNHAVEVFIAEIRPGEAAAALVDQMLQLVGQQAGDFHMGAGHAPGHEAQAFFAVEAQQRAVRQELQGARVRRHADQRGGRVFCQITANGFQVGGHAHIQRATGRGLELEGVQGVQRLDAGHVGQADLGTARQHRVIDIVAGVRARVVFGLGRQQPGLDLAGDGVIGHGAGAAEHQYRFRFTALVVDKADFGSGKGQAITAGHGDFRHQWRVAGIAAVTGLDAFVELGADRRAFQWRGQGGGAHVSIELEVVEGDFRAVGQLGIAVGQAFAESHRDALAQVVFIHRVGKVEGRHQLLQRRVGRVLVQLVLRQGGAERLGGELAAVLAQQHAVGQQLFLGQVERVMSIHRPVFFRHEH
ncbi:hypothetical protein [Pseudomonas sp. 22 E 5]|nr:hypothetical protein [Pseudomonas sp. 22 E 5]